MMISGFKLNALNYECPACMKCGTGGALSTHRRIPEYGETPVAGCHLYKAMRQPTDPATKKEERKINGLEPWKEGCAFLPHMMPRT